MERIEKKWLNAMGKFCKSETTDETKIKKEKNVTK